MSLLRFDAPIETRADFVRFLREIAADYEQNPDRWEPDGIGDLLYRMAFYASQPLDGFTANMRPGESVEQASWRRFADIVAGARVYE